MKRYSLKDLPSIYDSFSQDGEIFYDDSTFFTDLQIDHEPGEKIIAYAGKSKKCNHHDFIYAHKIIEMMQEIACDDMGDLADDYLKDITSDHEDELKSLINNFLVEKIGQPKFYKVDDIVEVIIEVEP